jgi:hypothetical protein
MTHQRPESRKDAAAANRQRQQQYRDRQHQLGRRGRLLYLTDAELAEVQAYIARLRGQ